MTIQLSTDTEGVIRGCTSEKDRQYNCQQQNRQKDETMIYKALHRKKTLRLNNTNLAKTGTPERFLLC